MNFATEGYTEAQVLERLFSPYREIKYEFYLGNRAGKTMGAIAVNDASISFDSTAKVMRTFSGEVKKDDLLSASMSDYRIQPWMCLNMGKRWVRWPLGRFIIDPTENWELGTKTVTISGYDFGKIVLDDKLSDKKFIYAGATYASFANQMLTEIFPECTIEQSTKTINIDREWGIGTSKLSLLNDLLIAINYTPIWFDEYGTPSSSEYESSEDRDIEARYIANSKSIILDGVKKDVGLFEVPNKVTRYVENVDSGYLVSTYTNTEPGSPYSTVTRGRTIADVESLNDIYDQNDLDAYTRRIAETKMQTAETITFSTLNMPCHGYKNCLFVEADDYGIRDKYIETSWEMDLSPGGTMRHVCEKAVIF